MIFIPSPRVGSLDSFAEAEQDWREENSHETLPRYYLQPEIWLRFPESRIKIEITPQNILLNKSTDETFLVVVGQ